MQLRDYDEPREAEGIPYAVKVAGAIVILVILAFAAFIVASFEGPDTRKELALALEKEIDASGDDDHKTLRYADVLPAVKAPELQPPREGDDYSSQKVIGFTHNDSAFAFLLNEVPEKHVLLASNLLGNSAVVVSHNYMLKVTRVLKSEPAKEPLDIRIGGWEYLRGLVFLLDDVRYSQLSDKLPLEDIPFEVTMLDAWLESHPESLACYVEEDMSQNVFSRWPANDPRDRN